LSVSDPRLIALALLRVNALSKAVGDSCTRTQKKKNIGFRTIIHT
jgi:hypothetical protein